jgi:pentapeptide MXKDX repeat protein
MENKLIDPYGLLGVDSRSNLAELKKNYYNMALLCHPDKGGNNKDMNVVSSAYNYIKEQLENVKETTYETLEDEFAIFCKKQEEIKPPTFGQIFEETGDWINDFNRKFNEDLNIIDVNPFDNNPLEGGYGEFMEASEYINNLIKNDTIKNDTIKNDTIKNDTIKNDTIKNDTIKNDTIKNDTIKNDTIKNDTIKNEYVINSDYMGLGEHNDSVKNNSFPRNIDETEYIPNETVKVKNEFQSQIMIYEEPQYLPDTITNFPIDGSEILDYSGNLENIRMNDYKMAFSPMGEKEKVNEKDYPTENIEYIPRWCGPRSS